MKCVRSHLVILLMIFLATWIHAYIFVFFSLCLCVMVQPPPTSPRIDECGRVPDTMNYYDRGPSYSWSNIIQTFLLSAYGFGYLGAQFPSGWIVNKLGPRWVIFIACMVGVAGTALLPVCAMGHWVAVFVNRLCVGLAGGTTLESLHLLLLKWISVEKRYNAHRIVKAGGLSGIAACWISFGILLLVFKWTICCYILAVLTFVMGIVWLLVIRDRPPIPLEESKFDVWTRTPDEVIPLKKAITSCPFLALSFLFYGDLWGLAFFLLLSPKFIYEMEGIGMLRTALSCSLAILLRLTSILLCEITVNYLLSRDLLERTSLRKLLAMFSHLFSGLTIAVIGYVGCTPAWAIAMLCLAALFSGVSAVSNHANTQDLSPTFAYVVFLIVYFIGISSMFILPTTAGFLLNVEYTMLSWMRVLWLVAIIYMVTGIVFLVFGSAEVQPWNFPHLLYMAAASHKSVMSVAFASRDTRGLEPPTPSPTT